jgi:ribosomal protein L32E
MIQKTQNQRITKTVKNLSRDEKELENKSSYKYSRARDDKWINPHLAGDRLRRRPRGYASCLLKGGAAVALRATSANWF